MWRAFLDACPAGAVPGPDPRRRTGAGGTGRRPGADLPSARRGAGCGPDRVLPPLPQQGRPAARSRGPGARRGHGRGPPTAWTGETTLRQLAMAAFRALLRHPRLAVLVSVRTTQGEQEARGIERVLGTLESAGLSVPEAVDVWHAFGDTVLAWAAFEATYASLPADVRQPGQRRLDHHLPAGTCRPVPPHRGRGAPPAAGVRRLRRSPWTCCWTASPHDSTTGGTRDRPPVPPSADPTQPARGRRRRRRGRHARRCPARGRRHPPPGGGHDHPRRPGLRRRPARHRGPGDRDRPGRHASSGSAPGGRCCAIADGTPRWSTRTAAP